MIESVIVLVNGSATTGKDTFVAACRKLLGGLVDETHEYSTISLVREACEEYFRVPPGDKSDEARAFWHAVKVAWIEYNNGPFNEAVEFVAFNEQGPSNPVQVFFIHVREPAEIQKLKTHFGSRCRTVLVRWPDKPVPDNPADRNVENYPYDYLIDNDGGPEDLQRKAHVFLKMMLGPEIMGGKGEGLHGQIKTA